MNALKSRMAPVTFKEELVWHLIPQVRCGAVRMDLLPDSDCTVLVSCPGTDEPVWLGYHDGECWRSVEGGTLDSVNGWAQVPIGIEEGARQCKS